MADFLDINGVPVSVADGSFQLSWDEVGDQDRAVDASLIKTRIGLKQVMQWTTVPLVESDADAWTRFILGYGQHWSFDASLYSDKGLGPVSSPSVQLNAGGGKYGGDVQIDLTGALATNILSYQPQGLDGIQSASAYTIMFWARAQDGATWNHYMIVAGAGNYKNGVALGGNDGVTNSLSLVAQANAPYLLKLFGYGVAANGYTFLPQWQATHAYAQNSYIVPTSSNGRFYKATTGGTSGSSQPTWPTTLGATVNDGSVVWTDQGPLSLFIDDLVILPFVTPNSWISALYTFCAAQAWPAIPAVQASGLAPRYTAQCIGKAGNSKLIQAWSGGVFTQNLQTCEFTLTEI